MTVYLETDRLILRQLTPDDLDDIEALDARPRGHALHQRRPPDAARGAARPTTSRSGSRTTSAATRGASGRRSSARPATSSAGSTSGRWRATRPTSPSSGTGSTGRPGARGLRDRGVARRSSTRRSSATAPGASTPSTMKVNEGLVAGDGEVRACGSCACTSGSGRSASRATRRATSSTRSRARSGRRRGPAQAAGARPTGPGGRLDDRLVLRVAAELEDERAEEHERPAGHLDRHQRLAQPQRRERDAPTTGSSSIRIPVRVPPMSRIAVRNRSDDNPAATMPARSRTGHGSSERSGVSEAVALADGERDDRRADERHRRG